MRLFFFTSDESPTLIHCRKFVVCRCDPATSDSNYATKTQDKSEALDRPTKRLYACSASLILGVVLRCHAAATDRGFRKVRYDWWDV